MIQFFRGDNMVLCSNWEDFEVIDCSNGEKLERWGKVYLLRPDPQIIWDNGDLFKKYDKINAYYQSRRKERYEQWDAHILQFEACPLYCRSSSDKCHNQSPNQINPPHIT